MKPCIENACLRAVRAHLREASDPEEAVHGPGLLVAVHRPQLGPPDGQLPVAVQRVLVDGDVARAVHGLQLVRVVLHLHLQGRMQEGGQQATAEQKIARRSRD
jgi:hypothetical protein